MMQPYPNTAVALLPARASHMPRQSKNIDLLVTPLIKLKQNWLSWLPDIAKVASYLLVFTLALRGVLAFFAAGASNSLENALVKITDPLISPLKSRIHSDPSIFEAHTAMAVILYGGLCLVVVKMLKLKGSTNSTYNSNFNEGL